jgi:CubicO group peptidase (beta-lactamase class C family)
MDVNMFAKLDAVIKDQYKNINGIVIVQKDLIVFEKYYHGYGAQDTHHVASVTKSVLSALIGIAVEKGFIKSIIQPVLDYFPEYQSDPFDFQKQAITIKHLLTMTAAFPFSMKSAESPPQEPLIRLSRQKDWITYILNIMGQKGQNGVFQYYTAGTHLLSAIITKTSGLSAREFANIHLLSPLGMRKIPDLEMKSFALEDVFGKNVRGWIKDPQGYTVGGWGLTMTPRDMARFGSMYLNEGNWEEHQVVSKDWINESTRPSANNYGYLWWLRDEEGQFSYSALGSGGNVICVIPERDLVVAIASGIIQKTKDRWQLIKDDILPAIRSE